MVRTERWPLVGRAEELRLVGGATVPDDTYSGVVLAGAAGVGKTRLAREALASAERAGAVVHWASATASARRLPLGAFAAALGVMGWPGGSGEPAQPTARCRQPPARVGQHIGLGRRHAHTRVLVLVRDRHVRVLTTDGQLLRELHLDPTRDYQPQARP
jgi:AAA ATPase domain